MNTIFLTVLTYVTIDAVASLAVFYYFKRNPHMLRFLINRALEFVGMHSQISRLESDVQNAHGRIDREIRNRRILKDRVARNAPKEITYEELQNLNN